MKMMDIITKRLIELKDEKYKMFISKLVPNVDYDNFIGVRANGIRSIVKDLNNTELSRDFLLNLPHKYYEENILHACFLSQERVDFDRAVSQCERFFPYIDNWAVCDTLSPAVFEKNPEKLLEKVKEWIKGSLWVSRFALDMLMRNFLEENFSPEIIDIALDVKTGEYYADMGLAWFLSYALVHQYEVTLPYIESRKLPKSVQKKSIQKAVDSFRISEDRKGYLKSLR